MKKIIVVFVPFLFMACEEMNIQPKIEIEVKSSAGTAEYVFINFPEDVHCYDRKSV